MEEIKTDNSAKTSPSNQILKPLKAFSDSSGSSFNPKTAIVLLVPIFLGVVSGYLLYKQQTAGTVRLAGKNVEIVNTSSEEGVKDASTFKDTATGTLQVNDGKITTEGTSILVRGDPSQNVYLTSSVVDLSKYVGKKVQVWGETFQGRKAGWLMDVGRIKVVG